MDRNGSVHTITRDALARVVSDAVTTLGTGVDGSVRRIETAFDGQGNAYLITSYDAASGGSIVNQVERAFNGLGQMTTEWQEHAGAVNTSTSAKVQYAYSEMPSGADHSRLTSITYPDGYVLTYNYSSGLNDSISRLSSLSDSTGTLEAYSYMGFSTVVVRSHPQPGIDLSFVGTPGDAGDEYAGLDRFGRVVDQLWLNTSTSTATDEFQYAYDVLSNRTSMTNVVSSAFDESYTYDDLNQLTGFARGSHTQDFDYDAVGNFDSVTTDGGTPQTRSANAQNEITGISGATTPTYDSNGNMTGDETGRQFVYDAWNRLVVVKNSGGTTLETFTYDGLNHRVTQTASGTTTDLYYSASWQVLAEKVGSNYTQRYVWSPVYVDAMILRDRDTDANGTLDERLWVQQDANWNVTALVNGSGSVVERDVYDAFGVQTVLNASWSSLGSSAYSMTYGFQGRPLDDVSGNIDNRGRWYRPTLGRPITMDPIRFRAGDVNFYRWEGDGPANRTDPSGLLAPTNNPTTAGGIGPTSVNSPYGAQLLGALGGSGSLAGTASTPMMVAGPLSPAALAAMGSSVPAAASAGGLAVPLLIGGGTVTLTVLGAVLSHAIGAPNPHGFDPYVPSPSPMLNPGPTTTLGTHFRLSADPNAPDPTAAPTPAPTPAATPAPAPGPFGCPPGVPPGQWAQDHLDCEAGALVAADGLVPITNTPVLRKLWNRTFATSYYHCMRGHGYDDTQIEGGLAASIFYPL